MNQDVDGCLVRQVTRKIFDKGTHFKVINETTVINSKRFIVALNGNGTDRGTRSSLERRMVAIENVAKSLVTIVIGDTDASNKCLILTENLSKGGAEESLT